MVARIWTGWTEASRDAEYAAYMQETALPSYASTPGNRGVLMLRRRVGDRTEFVMVTLWSGVRDVESFAGPEPERAVFYDRDDEFLVERDLTARHYEVYGASPALTGSDDPAVER